MMPDSTLVPWFSPNRIRWLGIGALTMLLVAALITAAPLRLQQLELPVYWLPQGVLIGGLILLRRDEWPAAILIFFTCIFLANWLGGSQPVSAALLAASTLAGSGATAWLYRTLEPDRPPLQSARSLAIFSGAAVFGCALTGIIGSNLAGAEQLFPRQQFSVHAALATLLAAMAVAPAILSWAESSVRQTRPRLDLELAVILAGIILSASLIFFIGRSGTTLPLSTTFILMPWLIWASLRRPAFETVTLLLLAVILSHFDLVSVFSAQPIVHSTAVATLNWLIFVLILLTGFTLFLVVKTGERNLTGQLLEERQIQIDTIFNTSPDGVIVIDECGSILGFNHTAEKLFGYGSEDVLGKNVKILMPPYLSAQHDGYMRRYMETGERRIIGIGRIVTGLRRDGSTFPIDLAVGEAKVGSRRYFTGFVRDLTEKQGTEQRVHELQDELMHSARLASLGEISSTIAHEVNQPLSAAGTYIEVAQNMVETRGRLDRRQLIDAIWKARTQVSRAGEIIKRVREFARKRAPELARADLNRVIEEACALAFVGTRNSGIRWSLDLTSELPLVLIDRLQIQQVIVNLVRNSIDALQSRGRGSIRVSSELSEQSGVVVKIVDDGPGIPDDLRNRLFTPFSTTKPQGTGLGLAICKSIIDAHNGRLWLEDTAGGGATFCFSLPAGRNERAER
jgi:two-component system sensor kinase FixL